MHRTNITRAMRLFLALALLLTGAAWLGSTQTYAQSQDHHGNAGAVYVLTNSASNNHVAIFDRASDGTLTAAGTVSTSGLGTGAGLGSQGALVLSEDNRWLFAVNAGSNDISVFSVRDNGLTLVNKAPSGGTTPISVTYNDNLLYVLNAGGTGNISGFRVGHNGVLSSIPNSTRPLSNGAAGPAQVQFSPNGRVLVVTEKANNKIDTYTVDHSGRATGPNAQASSGTTPFGFAFNKRGQLIVTEAFGGAPLGSAASSYTVTDGGILHLVSGSVATHQTAACWAAISKDGRYAYTTNAGSGTVTGYRIAHNGSLSLLNPDGLTGNTGAGSSPIDIAFSSNGRNLYVLTSGAHGIAAFATHADGSLTTIAGITGLPVGAVGLASR